MKHFTKSNSSLHNLQGKIGIQINNTVYTSKDKTMFFLKKTFCHKTVPNVYDMEFYRNFFIQYSLVGIVKPIFPRRNEI